jgi:hypothetical protein
MPRSPGFIRSSPRLIIAAGAEYAFTLLYARFAANRTADDLLRWGARSFANWQTVRTAPLRTMCFTTLHISEQCEHRPLVRAKIRYSASTQFKIECELVHMRGLLLRVVSQIDVSLPDAKGALPVFPASNRANTVNPWEDRS